MGAGELFLLKKVDILDEILRKTLGTGKLDKTATNAQCQAMLSAECY